MKYLQNYISGLLGMYNHCDIESRLGSQKQFVKSLQESVNKLKKYLFIGECKDKVSKTKIQKIYTPATESLKFL